MNNSDNVGLHPFLGLHQPPSTPTRKKKALIGVWSRTRTWGTLSRFQRSLCSTSPAPWLHVTKWTLSFVRLNQPHASSFSDACLPTWENNYNSTCERILLPFLLEEKVTIYNVPVLTLLWCCVEIEVITVVRWCMLAVLQDMSYQLWHDMSLVQPMVTRVRSLTAGCLRFVRPRVFHALKCR